MAIITSYFEAPWRYLTRIEHHDDWTDTVDSSLSWGATTWASFDNNAEWNADGSHPSWSSTMIERYVCFHPFGWLFSHSFQKFHSFCQTTLVQKDCALFLLSVGPGLQLNDLLTWYLFLSRRAFTEHLSIGLHSWLATPGDPRTIQHAHLTNFIITTCTL